MLQNGLYDKQHGVTVGPLSQDGATRICNQAPDFLEPITTSAFDVTFVLWVTNGNRRTILQQQAKRTSHAIRSKIDPAFQTPTAQ